MRSKTNQKRDRVVWGDVFPKYRISMLDNGKVKRVRVEGAKKLLLCLEKEVKILLGEEILHVYGEALSCINYAGDAVEVSGKVGNLVFEAKELGR